MNTAAFTALVLGCALVRSAEGALEWTMHPIPREGTNDVVGLGSVAFGNGRFVAIANDGQTYSATGTAPQQWTRGPAIPNLDLSTIIFAGGKFAAVGLDFQTTNSLFLSSTDGTNWTRQRLESGERLSDVAYGNGRFVVVGGDAVGWSTNGIDWVMETNSVRSTNAYFRSVDFVKGEFMATFSDEWGAGPVPTSKLATSADGRSWLEHSGQWYFNHIAYGRKIYVSLAYSDCVPCGVEYFSADGRSWDTRGLPNHVNGEAIAYANGVFVISGTGQPSAILSSTDGLNWDEFRIGTYDYLPGLAFGAGRFVAVGHGQVAVSGFVGSPPFLYSYQLSPDAIEFDFPAGWKTEWQVEASEDLVDWEIVKEFEVTELGLEQVIVPRDSRSMRFVRVREKH